MEGTTIEVPRARAIAPIAARLNVPLVTCLAFVLGPSIPEERGSIRPATPGIGWKTLEPEEIRTADLRTTSEVERFPRVSLSPVLLLSILLKEPRHSDNQTLAVPAGTG
jgi:hypothetical protein